MKKSLSIFLALVMIFSVFSVFADADTSNAMETVLINVKSRIHIPTEFSKFTPYAYEGNEKITYNFNWQKEDGIAYIDVSCDEKGRITGYYFYDNTLKSDKKITSLSKDDIIKFTEEFLKKAVPEGFANEDDLLVLDVDSWSVSGNSYRLSFSRYYKNDLVKDNFVNFNILVYDDIAYVRNFSVNYNYDYNDEFVYDSYTENPSDYMDNCESRYMELFPLELVYKDVYSYNDEDETKTVLVYRPIDSGYVSTVTKELLTEDAIFGLYDSPSAGGGTNDMLMKDEASVENSLTEKEISELQNVKGIISRDEADNILKKVPYTPVTSKLKVSSFNISQQDDKYIVNIHYESKDDKDYNYVRATLDGVTGKILTMYSGNSYYETKELTESEKKSATNKIEKFLKSVASEEFENCKERDKSDYNGNYSVYYERIVNGIRYINDGISVRYDTKSGVITNYRLDFEDDKVFSDSENVISEEKAYDSLLSVAPIKMMYIMSDGKYQQCFTISNISAQIDALTGEEYNEYTYAEPKTYEYADIKGHWVEEKVKKLAEIQIGLEGENFYPDIPISQYDLLRLFGSAIYGQHYLTHDEDSLYRILIDSEILTEEEKNPQGQVLREDAFVYMVRMDGLDRVAKLSNIFKVEYADENLLSEGKIGYPAILTGMNIICGNGGYLKPKTPITRAEAITMIYNYMIRE